MTFEEYLEFSGIKLTVKEKMIAYVMYYALGRAGVAPDDYDAVPFRVPVINGKWDNLYVDEILRYGNFDID